jgi:hypothetical protein
MDVAGEATGRLLDRRERDLEGLVGDGAGGVEHAAEYGTGYGTG